MNHHEQETLINFPCDFPIKVIGKHSTAFLNEIIAITRRHYPHTKDDAFRCNNSEHNRYISITITVFAEDKPTLDALYLDLTSHVDIKMVL